MFQEILMLIAQALPPLPPPPFRVIAPQFPRYPWLKPSDNKSKLDTRGLVVLIAKSVQAL
jgi:hypothetical protein